MELQEHIQFTEHVRRDMDRDDFRKRSDQHKKDARNHAISAAVHVFPDVEDVMGVEIPSVFGEKWKESVGRTRKHLIDEHGEMARWIAWLAIRQFEFAKLDFSGFIARILADSGATENELFVKNHWSHLADPDTYIDSEGWASVAFNSIGEIYKPLELLNGSPLKDYPPDHAMLDAIGVVWFFDAAKLYSEGDPRYMDILCESSDAFSYSNGLFMWGEGHKIGREEQSEEVVKSSPLSF